MKGYKVMKSITLLSLLALATISTLPSSAQASDKRDSGFEDVKLTFERVGAEARKHIVINPSNFVTAKARKTDTRISSAASESCERKRPRFFMKHMRWIRKYNVSSGKYFTSKVSKNKDHYEAFEGILNSHEGKPVANQLLAPNQSLFKSYTDPKLDIRQRVQWSLLLNQLVKDTVAKHEADYKDFDTTYSVLVLSQARCELSAHNIVAYKQYLAENGLTAKDNAEARLTALRHAMQ